MPKKPIVTHRIPFKEWRNSQLSVARFSGGIKINGVNYVLDYDNCPTKGEGEDILYFPDLVTYDKLPTK